MGIFYVLNCVYYCAEYSRNYDEHYRTYLLFQHLFRAEHKGKENDCEDE